MTLRKKNCFKVTDKPSEIRRLKALGYEEVIEETAAPAPKKRRKKTEVSM